MKKAGKLGEMAGDVVSPYFTQRRVTRSSFARKNINEHKRNEKAKLYKPTTRLPRIRVSAEKESSSPIPAPASKRRHISIMYETEDVDEKNINSDNKYETKENQWEPSMWREHLMNIHEMRKKKDAPVDVMGCDKLQDDNADPMVR